MNVSRMTQEVESLIQEGKYSEALQALEKVMEQGEPDESLANLRIDCLWALNEPEKAARECIRLARISAESNDLTRAIGFLRKAASIQPDHPAVESVIEELSQQTLGIRLSPEVLKNCSLFEVLDAESFKYLAMRAGWRIYMPEQAIIREGEVGDQRVFVLLRGIAEVHFRTDDNDILLAELKPGYIFGEISFLTMRPRSADVIARTRVEVLEIPAKVMTDVIEREPRVRDLLEKLYETHFKHTLEVIKRRRKHS